MPDRQRGRALKMYLAADVGREDDVGLAAFQRVDLVVSQFAGELGLEERVGAGGAAAQMRIRDRRQFIAKRRQQRLDRAFQFQAVLQRARGMKGHSLRGNA